MEERQDFQLTEFSFLKRPSLPTSIKVAAGNVSERFEFEEAQIDTLSLVNEDFLDASTSNRTFYTVQAKLLVINKIWNAANSIVKKLLKKVCTRPAAYEKLNLEYIDLDVFEWEGKLQLIQQISDRYELYENGTICFVRHNGAYVDLNSITGKLNVLLDAGIDVQLLLQVTVGKDDMLTSHERSSSNSGRDRRSRDRDYRYDDDDDDDDDSSTSSDESSKKKKKKKKRKSRKEKRKRKKKRKSRKRSKKHRRERDDSSTSSDDSSTSSDDSSTFSDDSSTSSDESGTRVKEKRRSQSESSGRERKKKRKEEVDRRSLPLSEVNVVNNETSLSRITESSRRSGSPSDDVGQLSSEQQNQLTKENDSLNAQVTALNADISRLKEEKQEQSNLAKQQANVLNAQVDTLNADISRLKEENQRLLGEISNNRNQNGNSTSVEQLQLELDELKRKYGTAQTEKVDYLEKYMKATEKMNETAASNDQFKRLLARKEIQLQELSNNRNQNENALVPQIILSQADKDILAFEYQALAILANTLYGPAVDIETVFEHFDIDETRFSELDPNLVDMNRDDGIALMEARPHEFMYSGNHTNIKVSAKEKLVLHKIAYCLMILPSIIALKERRPSSWIKDSKPIYKKFLYLLRFCLNVKFMREYTIEVEVSDEENVSDELELGQEGEEQNKEYKITQQLHLEEKCIKQFAYFMTENINKDNKKQFKYNFVTNRNGDNLGQWDTLRNVKCPKAKALAFNLVQDAIKSALRDARRSDEGENNDNRPDGDGENNNDRRGNDSRQNDDGRRDGDGENNGDRRGNDGRQNDYAGPSDGGRQNDDEGQSEQNHDNVEMDTTELRWTPEKDAMFAVQKKNGSKVGRLGLIGESKSKAEFLRSEEWLEKKAYLETKADKLTKMVFVVKDFGSRIVVKMTPEKCALFKKEIGNTVFVVQDFFMIHDQRSKVARKWYKMLRQALEDSKVFKDDSESAHPNSQCLFCPSGSKTTDDRPLGRLLFYEEEGKVAYDRAIPLEQMSACFNNETALEEFQIVPKSEVINRYLHQTKNQPLEASHLCHNRWCIHPLHLLLECKLYNILRGSGLCCGWVYYRVGNRVVWEPSNSCNHTPRCEYVKPATRVPTTFQFRPGMICKTIATAAA